jgi:RimJ/RimL family protein N-acetyltransferase
MAHSLWPLFDLRLRTPRLELRLPTDDELVDLVAVAKAGIHPRDEMPFGVPWTDLPSPAFERGFVQYHWGRRADWTPEAWSLELMVVHDGRPIGSQGLFARNFAVLHSVATGSWLGRPHQRRGFGKEMRAAVLALAFEGLGAEVALSEAIVGNEASTAVSRWIGYEDNGIGRLAPRGDVRDTRAFRLTRERWEELRARGHYPDIHIEGLEPALELFGASPVADGGHSPA